MEGMLNDLSIGTDTSRAFGEFVRSNQEAKTSLGKMEFTVQVRWFFNASHPFPLFSLLFSYLLTSLLPSLLPSLLLSSPLSSPLSSLLCPSLRSPILIDLTSNIHIRSIHCARCSRQAIGRPIKWWTLICPPWCSAACSCSSNTITWRWVRTDTGMYSHFCALLCDAELPH